MKKIFTLISIGLSVHYLNAQVVLNKANVPAAGTIIINYDANVPSTAFVFGKTGTNNTWDFSKVTVQQGQEDTIKYVSPSSLTGSSSFPTSDLVSYENGDKYFTFTKVDANGIFALGLSGDVTGTGKNYTFTFPSPILYFPFPFSSNTAYKGSALVQKKVSGAEAGAGGLVDSVNIWIKNYTNVKVIASGNIILPSGTLPALLVRNITTIVDSSQAKAFGNWFFPRPPSSVTDSTFRWLTSESTEAYAHVIYKNGSISDVAYHKETIPLGLSDGQQAKAQVSCFPNPAREVINFNLEEGSLSKITLVSASGKEVAVSTNTTINLEGLETGIYIARIVLKNGQVKIATFVKN